ncbi:autotransporter domain-containing protein [Brevundimonas sp. NPDC092305]|uniref:autotransporter domain-containing protein n=1 Tax=Brevundimonas sp. NPDC092305 TaxID=3363957 RepID=UPI0038277934
MRKTKAAQSPVRNKGRARLLTSVAALAVVTATPALAQQVVLNEGETVQGNVDLSPFKNLVVDISRMNGSTGELNLGEFEGRQKLLDGQIESNTGENDLWLRATGAQTRNIVFGTLADNRTRQFPTAGGFTFESVVYEASGDDAVLTLQNKARSADNPLHALRYDPLLLAGEGTIILDFALQADQADPNAPDRAITVVSANGERTLDVIVNNRIDSNTGVNAQGQLDPDIGLIDVRQAERLTFAEGANVSGGLATLVLAGEADVNIDYGARLSIKQPNQQGSHAGRIIRTSGTVRNAGVLDARANDRTPDLPNRIGDRGVGVFMEGAEFYNILTEGENLVGQVLGGQAAVVSSTGDNYVYNVGKMDAVNGAAIFSVDGSIVVRNAIHKHANGTTRAGEIDGGGLSGDKVAFQDIGYSQDLVVNSGIMNGDVLLGEGSDTFLYTEATNGVTQLIDGGDGNTDAYGRSVSASGVVTFANDLNTGDVQNFELHGVELNGSGLEVTLEGANGEVLTDGIKVLGRGILNNRARIADTKPEGVGLFFERFNQLETDIDFTNFADVSAEGIGLISQNGLSSFRNAAGTISGAFAGVGIVHEYTGSLFNFVNEGVIASSEGYGDAGGGLVFLASGSDLPAGQTHIAALRNSGTIRDTHNAADPTLVSSRAVHLYGDVEGGLTTFDNTGLIETTGAGGVGVVARYMNLQFTNSGTIQALGVGGGGLMISDLDVTDRTTVLVNTASGKISASAGGSTGGRDGRAFSFGVGARDLSNNALFRFDNAGQVEAMGSNSIAVAAIGIGDGSSAHFTLNNSGVIRGGDDTLVAEGEEVGDNHLGLYSTIGDVDDDRTVAGAIQTWRTTDIIRNEGTIIGSIDLHWGEDRFEHYGELDGDLRMGDENDTLVLGDGTIAAGHRASGGDGDDVILADMSLNVDRLIDAVQFSNFEFVRRLDGERGSGKLFLKGAFDVETLNLDDITIHIAQGDTVETEGDYTFTGGDNAESIVNAGRIEGLVILEGGDDTIDNSGVIRALTMDDGDDRLTNRVGATISSSVSMGEGDNVFVNDGYVGLGVGFGDGNDTFINSGTVQRGGVDLGGGDDRFELVGDGKVFGGVTAGDGIDTFVFRLKDNVGTLPSGFRDFESFEAYGPGTLRVILDQDYDTLRVRERANLELTNAANYRVKYVEGDDSAQTVTIDSGFTGAVKLFGGNDTLEMSLNGLLSGDLDGGDGVDVLRLNLTGASSIGALFNFETVEVTGSSPLTLTGEMDEESSILFDGSDNEFIIAENAVFKGKADGGAGTNTLRVATGSANSRTIVSGQLVNFQQVFTDGAGTLAFNGGTYDLASFEATGGSVSVGAGTTFGARAGGIRFTGNVDNRFTLEHGGRLTSQVDGGDGDKDVLAFSQNEGETQKVSAVDAVNFEILAASGEGQLQIDRDFAIREVQLEGGNIQVMKDVTLTAQVLGGAGDDTFDNAGKVDGDILLGDGDDTYVARTGSSATGRIDGGVGGNDTVVYSLVDGAGSLLDDVVNFESLGVYGAGTLTLDMQAGEHWNSVTLMEGANLDLRSSGGTIDQIEGDGSDQTVTIDGALTGGVDMGGGNDTLNLSLGGVLSGDLDGGSGDGDVLNLALTAASRINGMYNFETANITGGYALTLGGALGTSQRINFDGSDDELIISEGAVFEGTVDGGEGQNLLRVQSGAAQSRTVVASQILNFQDLISEGAGLLALTGGSYDFDSVTVDGGSLELGANTVLASKTGVTFDGADNRMVLGAGSRVEGGINAGAGDDVLEMTQASGQVRTWSTLQATGFERLESSGAGELRFDIDAAFVNGVSLNGGMTTVAQAATLTADVTGSEAAETFAILGVLNGDLDLGGGDDRLIFSANGSGLRSGGDGSDTLEFRGVGSAVVDYDASLWTGFDKLAVSGGTLSMTGESSWDGLSLTGGRLVGQAGSVITSASAIEVGAGSVFGSAGTVNGDINVRGTLSPGASPGTMTVNGDVAFFKGSNLLMELSPQASDLLKINGEMNIADGATIDITGVLPSTPGQVLDLIVASDGINGRFTTINKSQSVFGFVSQNGKKLQIRGEFQNDGAFGSNAQASIDYANAVLGSGQAVQTYTAAVPVLVDANGVSNAAAFAQLTPEAYGSAMAMQTETALSGVEAGRSLLAESPRQAGKFAFARGYGASTELDGRAGTGAASADIDLGAAYAGVGYVSELGGVVGGFIGFTNSEQNLRDLGAETKADGMIAGAFLGGELGGVRMGAQMTYERSDAETTRMISAAGGSARGEYDMESVAIDASMSYPIQVSGWTVAPTVGATWVSAGRDAVNEAGATSFGLAVDQDRSDTLFTDIGIRASTVMALGDAAVTPFAEIGVRTIQNDGGELVTGTLKGVTGFEMNVDGVRRDRSVARVAAGASYDLGTVRFDAGYTGEFGDASRHTFGAGVAVRF